MPQLHPNDGHEQATGTTDIAFTFAGTGPWVMTIIIQGNTETMELLVDGQTLYIPDVSTSGPIHFPRIKCSAFSVVRTVGTIFFMNVIRH